MFKIWDNLTLTINVKLLNSKKYVIVTLLLSNNVTVYQMQPDVICYMHYKIAKNYLNPSIICYTILLIKCTKRLENKFIQSMQQGGFRLDCGAVSFKVLLFYTFFPIQITCRLLIV